MPFEVGQASALNHTHLPLPRLEGLLGSGTFEGCLIGEASLNGTRAMRPTVKGTAGLLGTARWTINCRDMR